MNRFRSIWIRVRSFGQRRAAKREIDEELRFHLEERIAENVAAGMTPDEAVREARKRFGNLQTIREQCHCVRSGHFVEALLRDLRFTGRTVARSPGFTVVAVLMLAISIGSVSAMFSVMRVFVFEPFSYPNADRLVHVWGSEERTFSTLDYFNVRDQLTSFSEFGVYEPKRANLGGAHPETLHSVACTPGVLRAFGVPPALGRWFEPADEAKGAQPMAIISHRLWERDFGGDAGLIGRAIRVNGSDVTVVGVMPADFEFTSPWMYGDTCDLWQPYQLHREDAQAWWQCLAIGRLKSGVTLGAANAELQAIGVRLKAADPDTYVRKPFLVRSLRYEMTRNATTAAWMIFGATVLLLLLACANIAGMLLACNARRQGEFGVRIALGATTGQILRLAFCESSLLALAGTVFGAGLAVAGLAFLKSLLVTSNNRAEALSMDGSVLVFAAGLSLVVALLTGFPPASSALRISVTDLLRSDSRGATGAGTRHRLLKSLIVTQVAIAFVLANTAALLSASYAKLIAANASLASETVLSAEIDLNDARYATNGAMARFCTQLAERAAAVPGVAAAGITTDLPLGYVGSGGILANDEVYNPAASGRSAMVTAISPDYFSAAGMRLLTGRTLGTEDMGGSDFGVVVNRALAEKYWPHQDALGKIIRPNNPSPYFHAHVVGVVENVRQSGPRSEPQPQMYWTLDRAWGKTFFLIVRSSKPGVALAPEIHQVIAGMDPELPVSHVRTLRMIVREATLADRILTGMTNGCMVVAIALAAIGLYGTLSYHTQQRTREIGVRLALGAARGDVVRLVFRQGFAWVLAGIVIGLAGALASANALRAIVYDVTPLNPFSLAAATGAVMLAAALACWLPALRAARIEPMEALRYE